MTKNQSKNEKRNWALNRPVISSEEGEQLLLTHKALSGRTPQAGQYPFQDKTTYSKPKLSPPVRHNVVEMDGARLTICNEAQKQIDYLLNKFPSTEWSGIMVWDVIEGSLQDPATLLVEVKYILLMDIGSAAYTEYETEAELTLDLYDEYPDAMLMRIGHCHSHHSMQAYFSSTDTQELHDNVDKHVAYLSLIVSSKSKYVAKMAALSIDETRHIVKDFDDSEAVAISESKSMIIYNVDIIGQEQKRFEDTVIDARIDKVTKFSSTKSKSKNKSYSPHNTDYYDRVYNFGSHNAEQQMEMFKDTEPVDKEFVNGIECILYLTIPPLEIHRLLKRLLGINAEANLSVEVKAMDLIQGSALMDELADTFEEEILHTVNLLYIKDDAIISNLLLSSDVIMYIVLTKLKASAETSMPEGQTKDITLQTFNYLLTSFICDGNKD